MAEIEFSALKVQCLDRRIPDMETLQAELTAWESARHNGMKKISWQFTSFGRENQTEKTVSENLSVT
jgi:hypothetical protein